MDLFNNETTVNLLPCDGEAIYFGRIMGRGRACFYYNRLLQTIAWKNDEAVIFGKHIITKRKAAWYGNRNYLYTYSNTTKEALRFTPELLDLKQYAEEYSGATYNSCLLNLYHNGDEGMAWHSDDETSLGKNASIASMSFGAERKFAFKHKRIPVSRSVVLESGSLLLMKGSTQSHWLHSLPKSKPVKTPRINLTFRTMVEM